MLHTLVGTSSPWLAVSVGLVGGLALTPAARRLAVLTGDIDHPVGMKIHTRPTPLMGGAAVFLAFAVAALASVKFSADLTGLLVGGAVATGVGLIDEYLTLPPTVHLVGQIFAAVAGMAAGLGYVRTFSSPIASITAPGITVPAVVGFVFTMLWLVGMMNTMNFLDGLDGLASGVSAIAALLLAVWAAEPHNFVMPAEDLVLPAALAGALIGFLPYNWSPARIFLGDSGSMFLGFVLGALSIVGPAKLGTALLVLFIPVLDVAWAIVRRRLRGRSFLAGDKQHVYHRMIELGLSRRATVLLLYAACLALAALDLVVNKEGKLVAFVVLAIALGGAFIAMEVRASRYAGGAGEDVTTTRTIQ